MKAYTDQLKKRRDEMEQEIRSAVERFQADTGWFVSDLAFSQSFASVFPLDSDIGQKLSAGISVHAEIKL